MLAGQHSTVHYRTVNILAVRNLVGWRVFIFCKILVPAPAVRKTELQILFILRRSKSNYTMYFRYFNL